MFVEELTNVLRYDHIIEKTLHRFFVSCIARIQLDDFKAAFLSNDMSRSCFADPRWSAKQNCFGIRVLTCVFDCDRFYDSKTLTTIIL